MAGRLAGTGQVAHDFAVGVEQAHGGTDTSGSWRWRRASRSRFSTWNRDSSSYCFGFQSGGRSDFVIDRRVLETRN